MKTRLFFLACLFLLPSCFLTQSKPSSAYPATEGFLKMFTLGGDATKAAVIGGFFTGMSRRAVSKVLGNMSVLDSTEAYATATCSFEQEEVKGRAQYAVTAVDAGLLTFTSSLMSSPLEVPRDETYFYKKELSGEIGTGMYEFTGEGSKSVAPFKETISMPEQLKDVSVSGYLLADGNYQVRRDDGMLLQWAAPSTLNEANYIEVVVLTQVGSMVYSLNCNVKEQALANGERTFRWNLPASVMNRIQNSSLSRINISRIIPNQVTAKSGRIYLEGRRIVSNMGEVL